MVIAKEAGFLMEFLCVEGVAAVLEIAISDVLVIGYW